MMAEPTISIYIYLLVLSSARCTNKSSTDNNKDLYFNKILCVDKYFRVFFLENKYPMMNDDCNAHLINKPNHI